MAYLTALLSVSEELLQQAVWILHVCDANTLPPPLSRLNVIFSKFDEVQRSGNMVLSPVSGKTTSCSSCSLRALCAWFWWFWLCTRHRYCFMPGMNLVVMAASFCLCIVALFAVEGGLWTPTCDAANTVQKHLIIPQTPKLTER